jgi:malonyl-CoA/methylmalonyl-CoA synthetase
MSSTLPKSTIFEALVRHEDHSTAVIHSESRRKFTYGELLKDVSTTKSSLLDTAGEHAPGSRVALLVENGYDFVGMIPRHAIRHRN